MEQKRMFCEHGNAFVIPNAYNKYIDLTFKCVFFGNKDRSICQKCCTVVSSSRVR